MSIPQIFTWKDTGAPQINRTDATSMFDLLYDVCVAGYGDKSPMGWNVVQDGDSVFVTQGGTGDQMTVEIDYINGQSLGSPKRNITVGNSFVSNSVGEVWHPAKNNYQSFGPIGSFSIAENLTYEGYVQLRNYWGTYYFDAIKVSEDGYKLYFTQANGDWLRQLNMTTPFDVNTVVSMTSDQVSADGASNVYGFDFNNDGTLFTIMDNTDNRFYTYTMQTPFDIGTATISYSQGGWTQLTGQGVSFSGDGNYLFKTHANTTVYRYTLSTPYDTRASTRVANQSLNINAITGGTNFYGVALSNDGHFMTISATAGDKATYLLYIPVPNDLTSGVFLIKKVFDETSSSYIPMDGCFSPDLTKFFINRRISTNDERVYQYSAETTLPGNVNIPWIIVGNERSFYMICGNAPSGAENRNELALDSDKLSIQFFGDYDSYLGETTANQISICESSGTVNGSIIESNTVDNWSNIFFGGTKWRLRKNHLTGAETGIYASKANSGNIGNSVYGLKYPYLDGNTYLKPVEILGEDGIMYGSLQGAYYSMHDKSVFDDPTGYRIIDGSGPFEGDQFLVVTAQNGQLMINLSENWGA